MVFSSARQQHLFGRVIAGLQGLGYRDDLIVRDYTFLDVFAQGSPQRTVPAAIFGRSPPSYDTACFGILVADGGSAVREVSQSRALGAPVAFEVGDGTVRQWKIGADDATTVEAFAEHRDDWSPNSILRAKNIPYRVDARQLDFVDIGLLPALERHVRDKLDGVLRRVLTLANRTHQRRVGRQPDVQELFRLIFRLVAAKVLCDRRVVGFRSIGDFSDASCVLDKVGRYYSQRDPVIADAATRQVVADELWRSISFQNLSVEALAYVYEHTLIDDKARKELGTHSTPSSIARYIVSRLLSEAIDVSSLRIVEPCSGHAIFLVASLERLRDLLPADLGPEDRHRIFVEALRGFETDAFALEISHLCLMLADFPNRDRWKLTKADVFASRAFENELTRADIVLCNPPFEDFTRVERRRYRNLRSVKKPAELLHRVLDRLRPGGTLGFVLPAQFLDGRGYRPVREQLGDRFETIEVVALPERVFAVSRHPTVLLIGRRPSQRPGLVQVPFAHVAAADRDRFLMDFVPTWSERQTKTPTAVAHSLRVTRLGEVWERLAEFRTLGQIADLHRGVEWQAPFDEGKYISDHEKPGFRRGLCKVTEDFHVFTKPRTCYLSFRPEDRRRQAFDLPWDQPKVLVNAVRASAGPWRIVAVHDRTGLGASQNFVGVWPKSDWTIEAIAALLNGPIANAFVAVREGSKHNRKSTLSDIPVPHITASRIQALTQRVREYVAGIARRESLFTPGAQPGDQRELLLRIDAVLLRGYGLPPRLERQLLDFFTGHQRRVPFPFTEYFPASFRPCIPLWMLISDEFANCSAEFLLDSIPRITDPGLIDALAEVE